MVKTPLQRAAALGSIEETEKLILTGANRLFRQGVASLLFTMPLCSFELKILQNQIGLLIKHFGGKRT